MVKHLNPRGMLELWSRFQCSGLCIQLVGGSGELSKYPYIPTIKSPPGPPSGALRLTWSWKHKPLTWASKFEPTVWQRYKLEVCPEAATALESMGQHQPQIGWDKVSGFDWGLGFGV